MVQRRVGTKNNRKNLDQGGKKKEILWNKYHILEEEVAGIKKEDMVNKKVDISRETWDSYSGGNFGKRKLR